MSKIDTTGKRTISEWLTQITAPVRRYYLDVTGDNKWIEVSEKTFKTEEHIYCFQGRDSRSRPMVVECPESNCRVLIQSNGGKRGAKMDSTWKKKTQ